ncbi:YczE/YyaS/YitT family protein [Staphylospora marina]|uniref:YczE/YyaS/YitT family protein n=1 Tax=Staphylospora marina TaxID=2490858 RepID=UPI0013DE0752|nr:YitT family protein [Staphylospora marina]
MNILVKRLIIYVSGLVLVALGIALAIRAGIGTGAWDALNVGLEKNVGLTVGSWVILVGVIMVLINALWMWTKPEFSSLIAVLIIGPFADAWLWLISVEPRHFLAQLLLFLAGLCSTALGLAVYLQAGLTPTPLDRFMYVISAKTGLSLGASKTLAECLALVLAWSLDGPIGLGTLLLTFLVGPLLQFFMSVVPLRPDDAKPSR